MNETTAEILKHISDKLDVPVATLWAGLVVYAEFYFYQWIAIWVGLILLLMISVGCAIAAHRLEAGTAGHRNDAGFVISLCGMVAFAACLVGTSIQFSTISYALAAKYAPEAWATQYIVKQLRRQ